MAIVKCSVFSVHGPSGGGLSNFASKPGGGSSCACCCCCQQLASSNLEQVRPAPTANALAAATIVPVSATCAQTAAQAAHQLCASNGLQRDNQFDYHYLLGCRAPFSSGRQALLDSSPAATQRYQQQQQHPLAGSVVGAGGDHNSAQVHLRASAATLPGSGAQSRLLLARQQQESPLQIMDYFLRTWSGAQSAHDAISKFQLIVGRLTRVANYKCLVQALDETFAERQLEQRLQLEQQLQSRAKSVKELPSSCLFAGPFYAQTPPPPASADGREMMMIASGCDGGGSSSSGAGCATNNRRPFQQFDQQQLQLEFDRLRQEEQQQSKREQANSAAAIAAAAAARAAVASTTTSFMLMNKRELIGTLNSVFLGELRSVLIERAHEFTDCAYTKHEHRETIMLLLHCVKLQLNKLVKLLYRLRRKSSTINAELNLGQLRQLAIQIEETCAELKYELQTVVIEQSDELDRCNAQLDLIKQLKHHCLVGDSAKAQRCCAHFLEQSEQLVELCKMLNQAAPTHKMKITTKSLGIWFDSNAGQLLATARCLADSPRSRVLKDCAWAYIQVWCSFYDDFCQLARQLAYLTHAHYDQARAARVVAWRDQVHLRRQLAAEAANSEAAAVDELENYNDGGRREESNIDERDDPLGAAACSFGRSSAGCLTSNTGQQHNNNNNNSATIETLSDITDSPRSLDHYHGFGANYQQQRRAARGQRQQQPSPRTGSPISDLFETLGGCDPHDQHRRQHLPASAIRSASPLDVHYDNFADFGGSAGCNEYGDNFIQHHEHQHQHQQQQLMTGQQARYAAPEGYSATAGTAGGFHQQPSTTTTTHHHHDSFGRLQRADNYLGDLSSLQHSAAQNLFQPTNNMMLQQQQQQCVMQQQSLPPTQPMVTTSSRRVVINEAAPTLMQLPQVDDRSGSATCYSKYQQQQQPSGSGHAHQRSRHHPQATPIASADPSIVARRHHQRHRNQQQQLLEVEQAPPEAIAAATATDVVAAGAGLTSGGYMSATEEANEETVESECDTETTAQLASGGTNTDQQSSTTTEADKWSDSDADAIVRGAKEIAQMALSMYQFTKGEGDLNTTQDLFTQAELFAEEANELYKEVRCFSYKVPAGELKKELLSQLGSIPALVQQLQFIVKNPTVGKPATFAKVDSVIRETRALMEAVNRVVTATLSCRQHYNMAIASMRKRTRTLSPSYRGDKGFEFENHSSARQSAIGGRHGAGGGMGSEPDI